MNLKQTIEDLIQTGSTRCDYLIVDYSSYDFDHFLQPWVVRIHNRKRDHQFFREMAHKVLRENGRYIGKMEWKSPENTWENHLYGCDGVDVVLTHVNNQFLSGAGTNRLQFFALPNKPSENLDILVGKVTEALASLRLDFNFFPRDRNYTTHYLQANSNALHEEGLMAYNVGGTSVRIKEYDTIKRKLPDPVKS